MITFPDGWAAVPGWGLFPPAPGREPVPPSSLVKAYKLRHPTGPRHFDDFA